MMIISISVLIGLFLMIYSIFHHFLNRKKEGYKKTNFVIPLISGLLLFVVGILNASVAATNDTLERQLKKVTDERDKLQIKVDDLQAELDKAKAEAKAASKDASSKKAKTNNKQNNDLNNAAKHVTLGAGTFYVGQDIKPGRYVVSTKGDMGNFIVLDKNGFPEINEILGTNNQAVNNITVDLSNGQKIKIGSLQSITFNPKK